MSVDWVLREIARTPSTIAALAAESASDEAATREDVSRLFARAAFGATAADLDRWAGRPYAEVVDHLLDVPPPGSRKQDDDAEYLALFAASSVLDAGAPYYKLEAAQSWWLERMRVTPWPLLERMTLLWHGHFATAFVPYPDMGMMLGQNETLRTHALGSFRAMCNAMTVDPAMLWWLNGTDNSVPLPNENYAREFFELFTLGKAPQIYTERDVREAARAFTGWVADPYLRSVTFQPFRHDTGSKTILGTTIGDLGANEHLAVTDITLAKDVAPTFIATKLVINLSHVPAAGDPLVAKVSSALRDSDWDIATAVRTLLLAPEFRWPDRAAGHQHVRPPIDLVVAASKGLDLPIASGLQAVITSLLTRMGQRPFRPPNVSGWPYGMRWITPATVLARYELAFTLFSLRETYGGSSNLLPPAADLDAWAARFGLASLTPTTEAIIRDHLAAQGPTTSEEIRQLGVFTLLLTSPDWMVI